MDIDDYIRGNEGNLDKFHDENVVPSSEEQTTARAAIKKFITFLQTQTFLTYSVNKVVKSGSLGKGTAVRRKSDIDLVVFFNGIRKMQDFKRIRRKLLSRIKDEVAAYQPLKGKIVFVKRTIFSLKYLLDGQDLDILPAFDTLEVYGIPKIYQNISSSPVPEKTAQGYSASLAPLQVDFVKGGSADDGSEPVKRVIRLIKYWKKMKGLTIRSYTLELITIFKASGMCEVETDSLFRDVLSMLAKANSLQVAFSDHYESGVYKRPVQPYVLDPANPYMNTLDRKDIDKVATAATRTLELLEKN